MIQKRTLDWGWLRRAWGGGVVTASTFGFHADGTQCRSLSWPVRRCIVPPMLACVHSPCKPDEFDPQRPEVISRWAA